MARRQEILLIDIGNTSVAYGIDRGLKLIRSSRASTKECTGKCIREVVESICEKHNLAGAVICSVVPKMTSVWSRAIRRVAGVESLVVGHRTTLPITIDYPRPAKIGPDRLADASGAFDRHGAPVIVADFGTALTFDVVSRDGAYVGGAIVPGLPFMTDYLADRTALLPRIQIKRSRHGVGKSTVEAMQLGARVGYRGMARELFRHFQEEIGGDPVFCATGGHAEWVLDGLGMEVHFEPDLTLHGLRVIWGMADG